MLSLTIILIWEAETYRETYYLLLHAVIFNYRRRLKVVLYGFAINFPSVYVIGIVINDLTVSFSAFLYGYSLNMRASHLNSFESNSNNILTL